AAPPPSAIINDHRHQSARGEMSGVLLDCRGRLAPVGRQRDRRRFAFSREVFRRENLSITLDAFAEEVDVFRGDAIRQLLNRRYCPALHCLPASLRTGARRQGTCQGNNNDKYDQCASHVSSSIMTFFHLLPFPHRGRRYQEFPPANPSAPVSLSSRNGCAFGRFLH